jgi:hypothetical protein
VADASGVERVARGDAATVSDAELLVGSLVDAVLGVSTAPRPPASPPPASASVAPVAPPPTAAVATPKTKPPLEPDADTRTVRVDLRSEPGLRLMQSRDGQGTWETACVGSCDVALPLDATYRIVDSGGNALRGFRLDANGAERITVDVSTRSGVLDAVGALAVVGGTLLVVAGSSGQSSGIVLLGVLTGAGGLAALVANGSSVSQHASSPTRGAAPPRPRTLAEIPQPRATSAPILSFSF